MSKTAKTQKTQITTTTKGQDQQTIPYHAACEAAKQITAAKLIVAHLRDSDPMRDYVIDGKDGDPDYEVALGRSLVYIHVLNLLNDAENLLFGRKGEPLPIQIEVAPATD